MHRDGSHWPHVGVGAGGVEAVGACVGHRIELGREIEEAVDGSLGDEGDGDDAHRDEQLQVSK